MRKLKFILASILVLLSVSTSFVSPVQAKGKLTLHFFWGEGCPHCEAEKAFLQDLVEKYPQIEVKDYEIYAHPENQEKYWEFCQDSGISLEKLAVPLLFIDGECITGFKSKATTGQKIEEQVRESLGLEKVDESATVQQDQSGRTSVWGKVFSLALVDAINPCALAVLLLMLTTILVYNPGNRRQVLKAGLAFVGAVIIMYLIYGLVIVKFFQLIKALAGVRLWLYRVLGVVAIILGILEIKDFINYQPGGVATEMPLSLRPKAKKIIGQATSSKGAFSAGLFVTVFLLPCTIGPYLITGGLLADLSGWQIAPYLALYNLVFVLPMIAIVLLCFFGLTTVKDIQAWKENNIKKIHLFAGVIILILGLAMTFGWF